MSLKSAFNALLGRHKRSATITRPGLVDIVAEIKITPSNYFRNLEGPADMISKGREFIISKEVLDSASFPPPKRGDKLKDGELGTMTLAEVREMFDFGGSVIGYRVRTG